MTLFLPLLHSWETLNKQKKVLNKIDVLYFNKVTQLNLSESLASSSEGDFFTFMLSQWDELLLTFSHVSWTPTINNPWNIFDHDLYDQALILGTQTHIILTGLSDLARRGMLGMSCTLTFTLEGTLSHKCSLWGHKGRKCSDIPQYQHILRSDTSMYLE